MIWLVFIVMLRLVAWANCLPSSRTGCYLARESPSFSFASPSVSFPGFARTARPWRSRRFSGSVRCSFRPDSVFPWRSSRMTPFKKELVRRFLTHRASGATWQRCLKFAPQQGKKSSTCAACTSRPRTVPSSSTLETDLQRFSNLVVLLREQGASICPGLSLAVSTLPGSVSSERRSTDLSRELVIRPPGRTPSESTSGACGLPYDSFQETPCLAHVRGMTANRSYSAGDVLAWIPEHLQFSEERLLTLWESGIASNFCTDISSQDIKSFLHTHFPENADWQLRLAIIIALLSFKGETRPQQTSHTALTIQSSRVWDEHEALFPRDLDHMLLFWKAHELRMLEHRMVNSVFNRLFAVQSVAENWKRHFQGRPVFTTARDNFSGYFAQKLKWALGVVCSRSIRVHGNAKPGVLIPLLDLLNCGGKSANAKLKRFPRPSKMKNPSIKDAWVRDGVAGQAEGIGLVASSDIKSGDAITIRYCSEADMQLLNYGFFIETPREEDKTSIYFSANLARAAMASGGLSDLLLIPGFAGLPSGVKTALMNLGLIADTSGFTASNFMPLVQVGGRDIVEGRLLCAARILGLEDDFTASSVDLRTLSRWEGCLSTENDRLALQFLVNLLRHELHRTHSTSAEEDQEYLSTGRVPTGQNDFYRGTSEPVSANMEVALQFRIRRKRVLKDAILALEQKIIKPSR